MPTRSGGAPLGGSGSLARFEATLTEALAAFDARDERRLQQQRAQAEHDEAQRRSAAAARARRSDAHRDRRLALARVVNELAVSSEGDPRSERDRRVRAAHRAGFSDADLMDVFGLTRGKLDRALAAEDDRTAASDKS